MKKDSQEAGFVFLILALIGAALLVGFVFVHAYQVRQQEQTQSSSLYNR